VVQSIVAGTGVTVDATDPANPVVAVAAAGVLQGTAPMMNHVPGHTAVAEALNELIDKLAARGVITVC
jgi:hypothetical protein